MALLHNRINRDILKQQLEQETFLRKTISFYKYFDVNNPHEFRDELYKQWNKLNCFGRIYIAYEGINAQMSVPEHNLEKFITLLYSYNELNGVPIKYAVNDNGKSFYKLTIKVRKQIVSDGLTPNSYNLNKVGKHLSAIEFNNCLESGETVVIDMRNHYESEIGRFENAFCPDTDTFKETIQIVEQKFSNQKDKHLLLYCTGGIRCEKASAYLIQQGFSNISQLKGGIIEYANLVKEQQLNSKFVGKNFVFDQRLGESINNKIISHCHQCGKPADTHTNCANNDCHLLFIQCSECAEKYNACCSNECNYIISLPVKDRIKYRELKFADYSNSKIFKSRLRPELKKINLIAS
jgi:UPF0176 protein